MLKEDRDFIKGSLIAAILMFIYNFWIRGGSFTCLIATVMWEHGWTGKENSRRFNWISMNRWIGGA